MDGIAARAGPKRGRAEGIKLDNSEEKVSMER